MVVGITPEDFLKLGNPATCKQYIFTMANAIYRLFEELQIRPTKDRSGTILFQKLDTLRSGGDSKATQSETRQYCLIIAYTYIRIFQIFGALALTVTDDETAGQVIGVLQAGLQQPSVVPPGPRGPRGVFLGGSAEASAVQRGGFATQRGGDPLSEDRMKAWQRYVYGMLTYFDDEDGSKPIYIFDEQPTLRLIYGKDRNFAYFDDNGRVITAKFSVSSSSTSTKLTLKLREIRLDKVAEEHKEHSDKIKREFQKLVSGGLDVTVRREEDGRISRDGGESIGVFLSKKLREKYNDVVKGRTKGAILPGQAGYADAVAERAARESEVGVIKQLQTGFMLAAMKKLSGYKTTPFCVARGLQLLDANTQFAMGRVPVAQSSICQTKLAGIPHSVPVQGEPLDRTAGLRALEQLWFTQPVLKTDVSEGHDVKVSPADTAAYATYLQEFAKMFGKSSAAQVTGMASIVAAGPTTCAAAANKYLQISNPAEIQKILGHISKLYGIQLAHTRNVIRFLRNRLFLIQKKPDPARGGALGDLVIIHPKILQGGLGELAKVSAEARELLVKYYSACESTYQEGVRIVMAAKTTVV